MQKKNILFVLLFFAFGVATVVVADQQGALLPTVLVTDHSNSEGDVGFPDIHPETNGASFYWLEDGGGDEARDLFFRAQPDAPTQLISDRALSQGNVNNLYIRSAYEADGTPHFAWMEFVDDDEGYDLFYWNPTDGTMRLSDHTQTEGIFTSAPLILALDANDQAHILWRERNATDTDYDYFYWDSDSGTINMTALLSEVIDGGKMAVTGTTAHLSWQNFEGDLVYWNTNSQTKIIVPRLNADALGSSKYIYPEDDGSATVYWSEPLTNVGFTTDNCLVSWNSNTQMTTELVTHPVCIGIDEIDRDANGRTHLIGGAGEDSKFQIFYWNSDMAEEHVFFDNALPSDDRHVFLTDDGVVHVTWYISDSINHDLYHWDSVGQTVTNLSSGFGPGTRISKVETKWALSDDGDLHVLWTEAPDNSSTTFELHHWRSDTGTIQNLSTVLDMSDFYIGTYLGEVEVDSNGALHFVWTGMPNSGAEGLFHWDSAQNQVTRLSTGIRSTATYGLVIDRLNVPHVGWHMDNGFLHWDSVDGITDLTATTAVEDETDGFAVVMASDALGQVYVLWEETSDTAGEDDDMFATWTDFGFDYFIYLPSVYK